MKIGLLFILLTTICYSQTDSLLVRKIDRKVHAIDKNKEIQIAEYIVTMDTTLAKMEVYKNKIVVNSLFNESKSVLKATFYYDTDSLLLLRFSERSPEVLFDVASNITDFYYNCGERIHEAYYWQLPSNAYCFPFPVGDEGMAYFGFNEMFTEDFYHRYATVLMDKIKIYAKNKKHE